MKPKLLMTIDDFVANQKPILQEFLDRVVGPYPQSKYFDKVIAAMADNYYTGLLSPDDVSMIAELMLTNYSDNPEFHSEFASMADIEWQLRHDLPSAMGQLKRLKQYCFKSPRKQSKLQDLR